MSKIKIRWNKKMEIIKKTLVSLSVLAIGTTVFTACGVEDDVTVTPGSGTSISDSDSKTGDSNSNSKTGDSDSNSEAPKQTTYNVGDVINDGDLQITIQAIDWYAEPNEFLQPDEGNKYVKVTIMAQNNSTSEVESLSSWDFSAYADDENVDEAYTGSDEKSFGGEAAPGKKLTGVIFYEVPSATQVFEIQYDLNFFNDKRISITKTMV
jgi:hypothetical protein